MEVNSEYINFLLKLLNLEEIINIEDYQEELLVNLYITLLSLSNLNYTENIDEVEISEIKNFLTKLNNLKVKIQLKRKPEELTKFANDLITQYYENINILSTYIKDGIELENVINTMDAKSMTKLIDSVTLYKKNKEYTKEERNQKRKNLLQLLPMSHYYIANGTIYIQNNENCEELTIKEFTEMFNYLLNPDNYYQIYQDKANHKSRELIIANLIKLIIVNDKKPEELNKVIIPIILTYILQTNLTEQVELDTSKFNIDNFLFSEVYSLAAKEINLDKSSTNVPQWKNIKIPNEYLLNKLQEIIKRGMYYFKNEMFVLEHIDKNVNDFKVSISKDDLKNILKVILENQLTNNYSKKNIK